MPFQQMIPQMKYLLSKDVLFKSLSLISASDYLEIMIIFKSKLSFE